MLDDDALAAFTSAAKSSRSTLQAALHLMAKVFGPPSTCRHQFYDRRKVAGETTLAYRTALLALADAAFSRMDKEGKDAMVTEQLLALAHELGVPINVADEMDICSLAIATSIHAYEVLKRKPGVVCKWAGNAALAATIAEPQPAADQEQAFAASRPGEWRTGGRSPTRSSRKLEQPKPTTSLVVCYNCGLRGHVAAGCRAPRQRATGPRRDDDQAHKSSQQNPASRGTSHVRSTNTAHSGRRLAGTVLAHAAPLPVEERLVAQADFTVESHPPSDEGTEWLDSLCAGSANLSKVQLGALRTLLLEFADVFSKHKYDIGCTDLLRHHIATGDAAPIRQNPFRLSPAEKEHPSGQLSRWLEVLQDYQFTTICRKGLRHSNADALSRLPPCTDCTCLLGSARCKPPVAGTPGVALAATDTPGVDAPTGRDSLLSLPLIEWGRLQMSDGSLITLRRKVGAPEVGDARVGSWVCRQGLLMKWDDMSRRHVLVVPVAMRGASGLTAADRREPEPRGTHGSSMPGRCLPEPPAPPDVQPRLVPLPPAPPCTCLTGTHRCAIPPTSPCPVMGAIANEDDAGAKAKEKDQQVSVDTDDTLRLPHAVWLREQEADASLSPLRKLVGKQKSRLGGWKWQMFRDEQVLRAEEAPAAPPPTGPALDATEHQQPTSSLSLPPPVHPEAK
ncbi:unnamed protein product [Lampetra planeri]